ncbi:MAG: di-heme enzyme [Deltaproteobacteria bacterium]|nr:di-heme enzyme [Deltaproteobacteria bacterium]
MRTLTTRLWPLAALSLYLTTACGPSDPNDVPVAYPFALPEGTAAPRVPPDNPMSADKVRLGRRLFFDRQLSLNQTQSCGSCHLPSRAFTDGRATSMGSTGQLTPRNAMSLTNIGYASALTWANPSLGELERQALIPMFGDTPVELGLSGQEGELLTRLRADAMYPAMFRRAFSADSDPVTVTNVARAIASFERTLISFNAPYDRYVRGDRSAMTASAVRGLELFNTERLECYHCHSGFNFSDATVSEGSAPREAPFHNTALYNIDGRGAYPAPNRGVLEVSTRPEDMGRFRAPSLRNIELTAPYMHDGSIATLEQVIAHYAAGGRRITEGPNAGDGSTSPLKSDLLRGFTLTDAERDDLLAFLRALTDRRFVEDPRFQDPFGRER